MTGELPTFEELQALGLNVTRVELEPLDATCVRLIVWADKLRIIQLTADPRRPDELRDLVETAELMLCAQCGGDRQALHQEFRRRREYHGQTEHRR